jgi:hypothetical protein
MNLRLFTVIRRFDALGVSGTGRIEVLFGPPWSPMEIGE